jgi:hypothetical protein
MQPLSTWQGLLVFIPLGMLAIMNTDLEAMKRERARLDEEITAQEANGEQPQESVEEPEEIAHVVPSAPEGQVASVDLDDRDSDFNLAKDTGMVRFVPRHQLMAKTPRRQQDLRPQKFFWYKRLTDDQILYFTEGEAAMMMKSSHAPVLRALGVSDGSAYNHFLATCGVKSGQVIPKAQARKIISDALDAELASAQGHYEQPASQTGIIDDSIRNHPNAAGIIAGLPA